MALTIDYKEVRFWTRNTEHPDSVKVSVAVDPGICVSPDASATSELYAPGNGDGLGLAITRAIGPRRTIAIARRGEVELGAGIQSLNDGAGIFATSAGVLTDVATGNRKVATVLKVNGRNIARLEM